MTEADLLLLWGKTNKKAPQQYHPLLFHLLDVGYCTRALWDNFVSEAWKLRIAKSLGLEHSLDEARRAVVLLAAWHDLGKASPGFAEVVPRCEKNNSAARPRQSLTGLSIPRWRP